MAKKADPATLKEAIRYTGAVGTVANQGSLNRPRRWILNDPEIGTRNVGPGADEVPLDEAIDLVDRGNFEWAARKVALPADLAPAAPPKPAVGADSVS